MVKCAIIICLMFGNAFAQTYQQFSGYSDSYIYSNLFYAVNERCYGTMYDIVDSNELYKVEPIDSLFEVALKEPPEYDELVFTNNAGITITNKYLAFESEYPQVPDTNYYWISESNSEYPELTNNFLLKPANNYARYMWAQSRADTGNFYRIDLGMEIHKKTAKLVASGVYGPTGDVLEAMSNPVIEFDQEQQYEWYPGDLVLQKNSNLETSPYECWDERYDPGWVNIGSSARGVGGIYDPSFPDAIENCSSYRIAYDTNTARWIEIGTRYPNTYPTNDLFYYTRDGIGSSISNVWVENYETPLEPFVYGWQIRQFHIFSTNDFIAAVTNLEKYAIMTNFAYGKQYFVLEKTNHVNVKSMSSAVQIGFIEKNYQKTEEEIFTLTNEIRITETKDIILSINNFESLNNIPDPKLYFVETLLENTVQDENVQDQANALFFYSNQSTNKLLDNVESQDLPQIVLNEKAVEWRQITNENGFIVSERAPVYFETNNVLSFADFVETTKIDEPAASGYKISALADTNSTDLFTYTNGVQVYNVTQITYSVSTNLNQLFPKFPTSEAWLFLSSAKPLHLSPGYAGSTARISRQWLYKKWQQLKMMDTAQALYVLPTTNYVQIIDDQTNYFTSIETVFVNGTIQTTKFSNASFGKTTIIEFDNANFLSEKRVSLNGFVLSDFERTTQTKKNGRINIYKSKKIFGQLNVVKAKRYQQRFFPFSSFRYFNDLSIGIKYFYKSEYIGTECFPVEDHPCRTIASRIFQTTLLQSGFDREVIETPELYKIINSNYGSQFVEFQWETDVIDGLSENVIDDIEDIPTVTIECIGFNCQPRSVTLLGSTQGSRRGIDSRTEATIFAPVWKFNFMYPQAQ